MPRDDLIEHARLREPLAYEQWISIRVGAGSIWEINRTRMVGGPACHTPAGEHYGQRMQSPCARCRLVPSQPKRRFCCKIVWCWQLFNSVLHFPGQLRARTRDLTQ